MAGIGFELRRAIRDRRLIQRCNGVFSAAFMCFGGMLIGILLLAFIQIAGQANHIPQEVNDLFMSYVTNTMFFSMLVSSLLSMVLSRYVSDMLFEGHDEAIMPSAIGGALCSVVGGGAAFLLFVVCSSLPLLEGALLLMLYEVLCLCWVLMNYIGLVRDYKQITIAFLAALFLAGGLTGAVGAAGTMSLLKMIAILIVAYAIVDALLFRALFRGFPRSGGSPFRFLSWIRRCPSLVVIGLATQVGFLGHFGVVWYATGDGVMLRGLFACCPAYDFPAIVAYFCTIPAMIYFIAIFETDFYEKYRRYIDSLGNGGNASSVIAVRAEMISSISKGLRNFSSLQIISCLLFIAAISKALSVLNIGMTERMLQTYRMFCVGYSLYAIGSILMLLQMYFVNEKRATIPAVLFAVVTIVSAYIDGRVFGHGTGISLCISSLLYLAIAALQLVRCLDKLEFHILCKAPAAVIKAPVQMQETSLSVGWQRRQTVLFAAALTVSLVMILLPGAGMIQSARRAAHTFQFVPEKTDDVLLSPGMGYAPWANSDEAEEIQTTLVYVELRWADWEPTEAQYDIDYVNEEYRLQTYREQGRQVVFRFICDNPTDSDHIDIPDWLYEVTNGDGHHYDTSYGKGYSPNYNNKTFIAAHKRAIEALGEAFGKDDFFCFVELGSLGHWGEYHVNISEGVPPLPNYDTRNEYIKPYLSAFPNARFMTRYPLVETVKYGFGLYNDMTGDPEETDYWLSQMTGGVWEQTGLPEQADTTQAWKTQPIGGEFASTQSDSFYLHDHLSVTLEKLRESHQSFIGPKIIINETSMDYSSASKAILTTLGYRYYVANAEVDASSEEEIVLSATICNEGIAPIYGTYPVQMSLRDDEENIIWTSEIQDFQLDRLLPNESQRGSASVSREELDDDMTYTLTISILDERGNPVVPMAMTNEIATREYMIGQFRIR